MTPFVASAIRSFVPVSFAFLTWVGFPSASGAVSAWEPSLASAPAAQNLQEVEYGGVWLVEEGATQSGGHFVCMAEYDDATPACEQNADGTWDCWREVGRLMWDVTTCAAGFGLPVFKALRAVEIAHDALLASRAAKKAKQGSALAATSGAGAAVSVAWMAIAALLKDIMCLYLVDSFNAWKDCLLA